MPFAISFGPPFYCTQGYREGDKNKAVRLVLNVIALIVIIASILLLSKLSSLPVVGGPLLATGIVLLIGSLFIRCHSKPIKATKKERVSIKKQESAVPKKLIKQFYNLKKGSSVWLGEERRECVLGESPGSGGSKKAWKLSSEKVLMLPTEENFFPIWERAVDKEVSSSEAVAKLGLLGVQSYKVFVYLSSDSEVAFPAYISKSFESLATQEMYVIDVKNGNSSHWKNMSFFGGNLDRYFLNNWLPILKPLVRDLYIAVKNRCHHIDTINYLIIKEKKGYVARFFGLDFTDSALLESTKEAYRAEEITNLVTDRFERALRCLFFCQYDYDSGDYNIRLPTEYQQLITQFKDLCPTLLEECKNE